MDTAMLDRLFRRSYADVDFALSATAQRGQADTDAYRAVVAAAQEAEFAEDSDSYFRLVRESTQWNTPEAWALSRLTQTDPMVYLFRAWKMRVGLDRDDFNNMVSRVAVALRVEQAAAQIVLELLAVGELADFTPDGSLRALAERVVGLDLAKDFEETPARFGERCVQIQSSVEAELHTLATIVQTHYRAALAAFDKANRPLGHNTEIDSDERY